MNSLRRGSSAALLGAALVWSPGVRAAKIACVGDSITFGYGLSNPSAESYPAVLGVRLGSGHTVQNFGVSGATLLKNGDKPYWNEGTYGASDGFAPDVVVIMLGTNDAKPQNWSHESEFSPNYLELIEHYRALGALVYVVTPPPVYPPGAFDIPPDVIANEVVPAVHAIASDSGAPLVDVFTALGGKSEDFPDTVHPNATGAMLIAETVLAALTESGFGGAGPAAGAGGQGGRGNAGQGGEDAAGRAQGGTLGGARSGAGRSGGGSPGGGEAMVGGGEAGRSGGPSRSGSGAGAATSGSGGRASGGASAGGTPGGAGRASGAGTSGTGTSGTGTVVAGASGSGAASPKPSSDSGCGCHMSGSEPLAHPAWSALAFAVASAFGRRVARRRRGTAAA